MATNAHEASTRMAMPPIVAILQERPSNRALPERVQPDYPGRAAMPEASRSSSKRSGAGRRSWADEGSGRPGDGAQNGELVAKRGRLAGGDLRGVLRRGARPAAQGAVPGDRQRAGGGGDR